MALITPRSKLRAFLVPEFRTLGAAVTATSAAGPKPGGLERTSAGLSSMALLSSGTLDRALGDLDVVTLQAGGVDDATVRWGYAGETVRSWDPPVYIAGFEVIDRDTGADAWTMPHVVRLPVQGSLVASVTQNVNDVACWRQSFKNSYRGIWVKSTVATTGYATTSCLVALQNGRLLCFYIQQLTLASSQIRMSYSDDAGATWTQGSTTCLATPLAKRGLKYLRIRGVELNGLISIVVWEQDTTDTLYQYVSSDSGGTLDLVETFSTSKSGAPDLAVSRGVLYLATIDDDTAYIRPYVRAMASASMPFSSVEAVAAGTASSVTDWAVSSGGKITSAECALLADDDGALWLFGNNVDPTSNYATLHRCSFDGGATWSSNTTNGDSTKIMVGDSTTFLRDITVAPERGRAVLLHRNVLNATADDSLCASYLGGWTTVGQAEEVGSSRTVPSVAGYVHTWIGVELPQNTGAVYTQTLTGTATLSASGLILSTGVGQSAYYRATPDTSTSINDGVLAEFDFSVTSGTAVHDIRISDAAGHSYSVRVSVTTTTATLRDLSAGADIASVSIDATQWLSLKIAVDKAVAGSWGTATGRVRAWIRQDGPISGLAVIYGPRADRAWTQIGTTATLAAGVSSTNDFVWGLIAQGGATYRRVAYSGGLYTARNLCDSATGVSRGRLLTGAVSPIHIAGGLRVHGFGGPTLGSDTWRYRTAYEYAVDHVDPSLHPSPRRTHRSTSDSATHDIIWTGLDLGWRADEPMAILVVGANVGTATLYRDSTGTNKVADLDFRYTELGYTRARGQIIPATGKTLPFQASEGALKGAHVDFGGGKVRKIRTNDGGAWIGTSAPSTYAITRAYLESYDAADPASGSLDLWMPTGMFITQSMLGTDTLMLRTTAQTTAEGFFEYGVIMLCRLRVFEEYAYGRSLQVSPLYSLTTSRSGARTVRALGPARRSVEVAWDDGIDTTAIHLGTRPDHYTLGYTGADALVAPSDTPRMLSGLLAELDGARVPIGYAPAITQITSAIAATAPYRELDPNALLYGRIVSETLRVDTVIGDEQENELVRVGLVRLEQET